jgi:hypothetical protein
MSIERELLKRILAARTIGYPLPTVLVKEIEAELAKPEPEPEPVAYLCNRGCYQELTKKHPREYWSNGFKNVVPLYTSPPAREPLSDDDLEKIAVDDEFLLYCGIDEFKEIARAIEKALQDR